MNINSMMEKYKDEVNNSDMSIAELEERFDRTYRDVKIPRMYFESSSDSSFPEGNYYFLKYGHFPSNFWNSSDHMISQKFHKYIFEKYNPKCIWSSRYLSRKYIMINQIIYEIEEHNILIKLHTQEYGEGRKDVLKDNFHVMIFYREDSEAGLDLVEAAKKFRVKSNYKGNKISLIVQGRHGDLTTKEFEIKIDPIDIELNYGKDFVPVYNKVMKKLNDKNGKGLVLFHGSPGTGKSSLIKYIAKNIEKEVLFIPPHMAESISSPGFIPLLTDHNNSILIIEDAERIISSREGGNNFSEGVANVLNISDGILGDCLGIQIIATFNTNKNNIDPALMRKGRLIAEHEFKLLSVENANKLLLHLGIDGYKANKPMTLTDIYNIKEDEFKSVDDRRSIGFNSK